VKVYELIQALAEYDANDIIQIGLPGGNAFNIDGHRRVGYGSTVSIDVQVDESELTELYGEEE